MTTVRIALDRLHVVLDEQNPNKMSAEEYASLLAGMRKADEGDGTGEILQPILVAPRYDRDMVENGEFTVVDGAHRTKAARELGWSGIDAVVRTMTPEEVLAYRIGMNRNRGRVDLAAAALVVQDLTLKGWGPDELVVTGFSVEELRDLAATHHHATGADLMGDAAGTTVEDDDAPAANPRPFILELTFPTAKELAKVKRLLRKAAGNGQSLEHGLLTALGAQS
jgi:hypothetical protein